jgi:hypothetical protein
VAHKIKLGELLVRAGVLDETRLKAALAEQERWGGRLGSLLVSMGFVSEDLLVKALSKQLAVPMARLDAIDVPKAILSKIDLDFAKMHALCPERYIADRKTLVVAMADPINVAGIDEVVRRTGCRVQPTVAGERSIMRAIAMTYGAESQSIDPPAMPQQDSFIPSRSEQRNNGSASSRQMPAQAPSRPQTPASPQPPQAAIDLVATIDSAQKKQLKAIRAMAELLIEKGLISRDEYYARINRRGS